MNTDTAIAQTIKPAPQVEAIGDNLTDVLNIAKICTTSGYSRNTIKGAIDRGEMKSFRYARQICVLRTEYLRWLHSLGEHAK
ncbi:MAG: hypothetical protein AAFR51_02065 [Pseudomonadota bacterium]